MCQIYTLESANDTREGEGWIYYGCVQWFSLRPLLINSAVPVNSPTTFGRIGAEIYKSSVARNLQRIWPNGWYRAIELVERSRLTGFQAQTRPWGIVIGHGRSWGQIYIWTSSCGSERKKKKIILNDNSRQVSRQRTIEGTKEGSLVEVDQPCSQGPETEPSGDFSQHDD